MAIAPVGRESLENDTVECAGAPGNLHLVSTEAAQHPAKPIIQNTIEFFLFYIGTI